MKIITGFLKGKTIKNYNIDGTRPTMDRVKESIFSSIQTYINDSVCLDLFAGSGNLGIEAISEGAKHVYFNDNNKRIVEILKKEVKEFNIEEKTTIFNNDYKMFLDKTNEKFDIIFLDPPYKLNVISEILDIINKNDLLNENGLIICEYDEDFIKKDNYDLLKEKQYGDKKVSIFKKRG